MFCRVWKEVTLSGLLEKQNSIHDVQPFAEMAATMGNGHTNDLGGKEAPMFHDGVQYISIYTFTQSHIAVCSCVALLADVWLPRTTAEVVSKRW